jgi:putative ABC transport system permease protein
MEAMTNYYLRMALVSLRRNVMLSALVVLAIALGVALTMAAYSVLFVMSRDPIPEKSGQLYAVQIDNGGPQSRGPGDDEPPTQLTYRDAKSFLDARKALRQVAMHQVSLTLTPSDPHLKPYAIAGRATSGDFFQMFGVPMLYGSGWSESIERSSSPVVVLSKRLNQKLFRGANSIGESVELDQTRYQVVGVMNDWDPKPRFYDVIGGQNFDEGEDLYLPLPLTIERGMSTSEYEFCNAGPPGETFATLIQSECVWLQFWVELPTASDAANYRTFLANYSKEQQRLGRFNWEPNVRLRNVNDWLIAQKVIPNDARLSVLVAFSFLVVCLVSAMGLMLAKAFSRSSELGIRRALGASARDIFAQSMVEATVIGIAGGIFGLLLTAGALWTMRQLFPGDLSRIAVLNLQLSGATFLVALAAALAVGLFPAWRSMKVAPALQMKGG